MKEYLSLVPGPTQVHPKILEKMSQQVITHLNDSWKGIYLEACENLKKILKTDGDVFLMASSGTGAMEAALSSIANPGEKILVLSNGLFGERIRMIAESYRLETETLSFPTDNAIDPAALKERLSYGTEEIAAVGAVYSESQNGILNPIKEIAAICRTFGVPLIVDTVSALGGVSFEMDAWGVDIAVAATQKCLGMAVGLSVIAVGKKSWKYLEKKKGTGFYFNLNIWRNSLRHNSIHPHPWSMSETLVFGLNEACRLILEEGLAERIKRHQELYQYYARALEELGFSMFVPPSCACPTVISVCAHPSISIETMAETLKNKYSILIGVGIYEQHGKIWRIGNMAEQARKEKARYLIQSLTEMLAICSL